MNDIDKKGNNEEQPEVKHPKLWGIIYIMLGLIGLFFSANLLMNSNEIVPLIGAITGGVLLGALSLFLLVLGYRVLNKDYE